MPRIVNVMLFLCLFFASLNNSKAASPIRVIATTTVVADLVEQVGGDLVAVESLMADGVDPHSYRATPRDIDATRGFVHRRAGNGGLLSRDHVPVRVCSGHGQGRCLYGGCNC